MDLLLLSNSTAPGRGYLDHARHALAQFLEPITELVFVPYALADHDGYTAQVARALEPFDVRVTGVHTGDPVDLVRGADAIFIGGGNTLADITEHATGEGKIYLCAIKDAFSGRIVGYSIDSRMKSRLAVTALNNAVARRGDVAGCVLHTDRGSQFRVVSRGARDLPRGGGARQPTGVP